MLKSLIPAIRATFVITLLTGLAFPFLITGLAQVIFPAQAHGSLIKNASGHIVGSSLIGQSFGKPEYFHPRPSAAGSSGYAGEASGGTNLGPTSDKLINGISGGVNNSFDGIKQLASRYRQENMLTPDQAPPVDAVTRSASGLDPDISEANALMQVKRIARARNISPPTVAALVETHKQGRLFGIIGEPFVRVLPLNIALDELSSSAGKLSAVR